MADRHYDYFVIGAGSGGVRSSRIAASHGARVGIAESSDLGGTCVNLGCIPKKLMAYGADYGPHFEDARSFGWSADNVRFDWKTLIDNKQKEITRLNGIYENILEKFGVELVRGFARFVDPHTLEIDGTTVTADQILIATGGKPRRPDIPGGDLMAVSDDFFHWPKAPKKAVILGGGYIAVEFAHILHGLGTDVTLIYYKDLFLRSFDTDIREHLATEMRKQGIDLRFNTEAEKIEKTGDGFTVHLNDGEAIECDLPLAAIGRSGNTDKLGLDKIGLEANKAGRIAVNAEYQTGLPHIYALGDVTDTYHLTPVAIAEGHVLADRLFGKQKNRSVHYNNVATVIFSSPPIGTIGLSEDKAREKGLNVEIYKSVFTPLKHQVSGRDERSLMKLVVEKENQKVIGCHMIGMDAPEIMQGFAVAMNMGATKADFDRTIAIHPTSSEEFVLMRESVSA